MKIAILGSAPSSIRRAPFGDPTYEIWACSPGAYPVLGRINEFFEVHRWEPGVVGRPETQKPWFTPEYVQWLKTVPPRVWVADPAAQKDIGFPRAQMLPWPELVKKYGHYVWTSTVSYMAAMAIDRIQAARDAGDEGPHLIAFYGVDMAANEELYTSQRAACQFFIQVLVGLQIEFYIPPESDLATPPPMYGVSETHHRSIKLLERQRELQARLQQTEAQTRGMTDHALFIKGALDDLDYQLKMWNFGEEPETLALDFPTIFPEIEKARLAKSTALTPQAQALAAVADEKLKAKPEPKKKRPKPAKKPPVRKAPKKKARRR